MTFHFIVAMLTPFSSRFSHGISGSHGLTLSNLQEALPLSARYLLSDVPNRPKPDVASLMAENHALQDAMEQQRFRRKVRLLS